jgi:hypothetical protein
MRRALPLALLVLWLLMQPRTCFGQARPRWDVWRVTVDQIGPWEVTGPRIGFHALRAGASAEGYRVLRALRVPPWPAQQAAWLATGVLPHAVGLARHEYPLDAPDVAGDAVIAFAGAVTARRCDRGVRTARCLTTAGLALVVGVAAMGITHP